MRSWKPEDILEDGMGGATIRPELMPIYLRQQAEHFRQTAEKLEGSERESLLQMAERSEKAAEAAALALLAKPVGKA